MPKQTPIVAAFIMLASLPLLAEPYESLDSALRRQVAAHLRAANVDLCETRAVGQAFDIRDLSAAPLNGGLAVTYTLVRYESCEEGAAYYEVRRSETWTKVEGRWRQLTSEAKR